jgi:Na+/H+-translocating membrane pyrophosphatase
MKDSQGRSTAPGYLWLGAILIIAGLLIFYLSEGWAIFIYGLAIPPGVILLIIGIFVALRDYGDPNSKI